MSLLLAMPGIKPDIAEFTERRTPLMEAACNGHAQVVKSLLEAGADAQVSSRVCLVVVLTEQLLGGHQQLTLLARTSMAGLFAMLFGTAHIIHTSPMFLAVQARDTHGKTALELAGLPRIRALLQHASSMQKPGRS